MLVKIEKDFRIAARKLVGRVKEIVEGRSLTFENAN